MTPIVKQISQNQTGDGISDDRQKDLDRHPARRAVCYDGNKTIANIMHYGEYDFYDGYWYMQVGLDW